MPTRLADHTLLLKGRRYLDGRDLRWTKYECCSNCIYGVLVAVLATVVSVLAWAGLSCSFLAFRLLWACSKGALPVKTETNNT